MHVNRRALEKYGLKLMEVRGRAFPDIYPWSSSPALQAELRAALARAAEGQSVRFDAEVTTPSGRAVVGEAWITPIADEAGRVTHLIFSGEDVTERKRAEAALRESEERFQIAFKKAPFATALSRVPEGVFVEVNEAFERVLGYSQQEVAGKTSLELGLYDPERREQLAAEFRASGTVHNQEVIFLTKSGERRVMLANSNLVEIDGRQYILSAMQDITERRQAEATLRAAEERFRAFMDHSPAAAWITDADGTFLFISGAYKRMFRLPTDDIVGKSVFDVFPQNLSGNVSSS